MSDGDRRLNVLWVIPCFAHVLPKAFGPFLAMAFASHGEASKYSISVHVPERQLLHSAMNNAAATMLAHKFDVMIVSDDDCIPPMDAIPRLLRHYEAGHHIVGGLGFMRNYPYTTTVGRYFETGSTLHIDPVSGEPKFAGFRWLDDIAEEPDDLVDADFCGFPIALISRAVFERIPAPWFGTWLDGGGCTHDVYFGAKAKRAGFAIKVDRTMPCGHIADAPVVTFDNRGMARHVGQQLAEARRQVAAAAAVEPVK